MSKKASEAEKKAFEEFAKPYTDVLLSSNELSNTTPSYPAAWWIAWGLRAFESTSETGVVAEKVSNKESKT